MGKGGATLVLLMLFMAVTSTGSAEQIAVSSLFAYDVYRSYINRKATGKDVRHPCLFWDVFFPLCSHPVQNQEGAT